MRGAKGGGCLQLRQRAKQSPDITGAIRIQPHSLLGLVPGSRGRRPLAMGGWRRMAPESAITGGGGRQASWPARRC